MRAVLDETLRLFPPGEALSLKPLLIRTDITGTAVPINHRNNIEACTLPPTDNPDDPDTRPYYIPPYTDINFS